MYYNVYWRIKGEKEIYKGAIDLNTPLIHKVGKEFKKNNPYDIDIIKIEME